jgi:hypothetical protein
VLNFLFEDGLFHPKCVCVFYFLSLFPPFSCNTATTGSSIN